VTEGRRDPREAGSAHPTDGAGPGGQDDAANAGEGAAGKADAPAAELAAERRRRRARVFGEVLPEGTTDDRDDTSPGPEGAGSDDWWRRQVPPHHG
jgi:hypothetical protein